MKCLEQSLHNCNNTPRLTPLRLCYALSTKKGGGYTLVIIYQGCLGTRKVFPRCGRIFLIKKPPVDSSDIIPHLEWTMFGWLGSILKEEQYTVEGFPDWTNIQFYVRVSQYPASLFPGVLLKVVLRILQVLLPSDWTWD